MSNNTLVESKVYASTKIFIQIKIIHVYNCYNNLRTFLIEKRETYSMKDDMIKIKSHSILKKREIRLYLR